MTFELAYSIRDLNPIDQIENLAGCLLPQWSIETRTGIEPARDRSENPGGHNQQTDRAIVLTSPWQDSNLQVSAFVARCCIRFSYREIGTTYLLLVSNQVPSPYQSDALTI